MCWTPAERQPQQGRPQHTEMQEPDADGQSQPPQMGTASCWFSSLPSAHCRHWNPHHSKPPQPETAENSMGLSAGGKQGHDVCLGLQPPPPDSESSTNPGLSLSCLWTGKIPACTWLGQHRLWKHWPFSHFKGLLFMAFQLSLVRSRKSEVVSPGSVNRMWLPWVIILFLLKCRWLLTPGSQTPMAHSSGHTHCFPSSHFRAAGSNFHITQLELHLFRVSSQPKGLKNSKMCSKSKE